MTPTDPAGPSAGWRGLAAVIASAGIVGITYGCLAPLLALLLEKQGHPHWAIGINGSAGLAAAILLAPLVPKAFARLGFLNAMLLAVLGEVVCILLLLVWRDIWFWTLLRFAIGFFGTIQWIGSETWIVSAAPAALRGRVIALYMIAISAGFALGPVVVDATGSGGSGAFLVAAGLILAAGLLIWSARGIAPKLPEAPKAAFLVAFRVAPLVMAAALLAGFVDMGLLTHLVNFGRAAGFSEETALKMLSVLLAANLVMQFPVGWLADRVDKRRLIVVFGLVFFLAPIAVNATVGTSLFLWPAMIVWGICSMGIYTVALTVLGERFGPALLSSANAAIVALYQLGGLSGTFAGGAGMDLMGNPGLMWVFSAAGLLFLCFAAYRTCQRGRAPRSRM
ncbi:MAG: MFS transporter [Rhodospirillales bacterium]|nr:MFS transporter [Rhodospirillales bacterium]